MIVAVVLVVVVVFDVKVVVVIVVVDDIFDAVAVVFVVYAFLANAVVDEVHAVLFLLLFLRPTIRLFSVSLKVRHVMGALIMI